MEATGEEDLTLLAKIRPPRLEDAGLEDCALPPDVIYRAFLKAAATVSSISGGGGGGDCVADPWPKDSPPSDALIGIAPERGVPGPCANEKGGALVGECGSGSDVVVVGGKEDEEDDVVVVDGGCDGGENGGCVDDGMRGVEGKGEERENEGEGEAEKKPGLIEGYFFIP